MSVSSRIESSIDAALRSHLSEECPPRLAEAVRYAVVPGGARIRPKLSHAVASACHADDDDIVDAAAIAIELLHCASLVHDDLPCFDNAALRRGRPSVHVAFGERLALLCGDELIVMAFEVLAAGASTSPQRLQPLMRIVGQSVGAPNGIIAGQAYECEPGVDLVAYQKAKTGALFSAATAAGAAAAGTDPMPWKALGDQLGQAYQVADDLLDKLASVESLGKPVGQDELHDRPNAVREWGLEGAIGRLEMLVAEAVSMIPDCPGREPLGLLVEAESNALITKLARLRVAA
ncbi:MAG: polyprenyl synthetase family protein [Pseudomonadota bacterium]